MHLSVSTIKRLGLSLSVAALLAASTPQTAPAAAASHPLPGPSVVCGSRMIACYTTVEPPLT